jgi:hypothetical protein
MLPRMARRAFPLLGAMLLAGACFPPDPPPNHAPGVKVAPPAECTPTTALRTEAEQGSLRAAFTHFAAVTPCDAHDGAIVVARVLIDLAHYEDALKSLERASGPDVEALRTEIAERRAPRSADAIAASAAEFRSALQTVDAKEAETKFLRAWSLDAPNGQALLHAALRASEHLHVYDVDPRATPDEVRERVRVLRLLERAEAELGIETGAMPHAGVAAPPVCTGHSSNHLAVAFLSDSIHGVVRCTDATMVFESGSGGPRRVAQWSADGAHVLDPSRLPRLRWVRGDAQAGFVARSSRALDAPPVPVALAPKEALGESRVLRDGTTAFATVIDTSGAPLRLHLFGGGKELARVPLGYDVHELDDGRIVVRTKTGAIVSDRAWQHRTTLAGDDADVSPDGAQLLFTKPAPGDEAFHPTMPWLKSASGKGGETDLRPLLAAPPGVPLASVQWARVGPVKVDGRRSLGTMPGGDVLAWPAVTIAGVHYLSTDEVTCAAAANEDVFCMDPKGPVDAVAPWSDALVCRIGPHVLPLGACPSLVARK